ncbi:MAG: sulfotransferase family protein [Pseudomonadales bacterium]
MAFDIECAVHGEKDSPVIAPTYIAGLARAGTTILLQTLCATGRYTTLTYRNMPFVMAPRLWSQLSRRSRKSAQAAERAHGDRLKVDYDSPEAFEEVFWMTATKRLFVATNKLHPHKVQGPGIVDYRQFVANVLGVEQKPEGDVAKRYLAKNNNNLLRLDSIFEAFPDARIVVPFRNPYDHAKSLLAQHARFSEQHARDSFSLEYMNWLGHFEFGSNHKPFGFDAASGGDQNVPLDTIDYWLDYWARIYAHVASKYAERVFFFDYDSFCQDPNGNLKELAHFLNVDEDVLAVAGSKVEAATRYAADDSILPASVRLVHEQLISLTKEQQFSGRS